MSDASSMLSAAVDLFNKNNFEKSNEILVTLISQSEGEDPYYYFCLGRNFLHLDNLFQARKWLNEALRLSPFSWLFYELAILEEKSANLLAAGDAILQFIAGNVKNIQEPHTATILRIAHAVFNENPTLALRIYNAADSIGIEDYLSILRIAESFINDYAIEDATRKFVELLSKYTLDGWGFLCSSRLSQICGETAAARDAVNRAVAAMPDNLHVLTIACHRLIELGDIEAAAELLERAFAIDPDDIAAIMAQADMAIVATEFAEALACFQRLIAFPHCGVAPYLRAADLLVDMEGAGIADALALLNEAEARFGALPDIATTRARLLLSVGDYDQALAVAWQAGARFLGHFGVWLEQVEAAYRRGDLCEALCLLDRSPACNGPQRSQTAYWHALIAADCWCIAEAITHCRRALAHNPGLAAVAELLAKLHLLRLDLPEAANSLQLSVRLSMAWRTMMGLSLNPSQTMVGMIINEYRLEAPALAEMLSARSLAPHARIAALRSIAARYPDYTPAAMTLLIEMRRHGLLIGPAACRQESAAIPKQIAQYWDTPELSNGLQSLVASWCEHNPEYQHTLFDDDAALAFLRHHYPASVTRAYRRVVHPAQKADFFRLALLYALGGIYADVDDRCLRPLSNIVEDGWGLIVCQEDMGSLGNNFIAAAPRHPVIGLALDGAVASIERGDRDMVWLATGPGLLTRAFVQCLPADVVADPHLPGGVLILGRHHLATAIAVNCRAAYKRSVKHWPRAAFARARSHPAPPAGPPICAVSLPDGQLN